MPTTEHTINDALAACLRATRRVWREGDVVKAEKTGMLRGSTKQPDILVIEPNVSPVTVETEVLPATTVEAEAANRLGERLRANGKQILSSIAVRLPARVRQLPDDALKNELSRIADLEMAFYTGKSNTDSKRWPPAGWVIGGINELSELVQSASIPPEIIDSAAEQLVTGVSEAAGLLADMAAQHPRDIHNIAAELKQEDDEQTRRMAATILANAFVFHGSLAGGPGELAHIRRVDRLRSASGVVTPAAILKEWRAILDINYWPIFDIARRILENVPVAHAKPLIEGLIATADQLLESQLMRSHDLTGAVFQKLIADRKFLAAFYTMPASAALLAGLVIPADQTPDGHSWGDSEHLSQMKIADFACGTGTLLSAAYQRIGQLHEIAGGNAEAIHPAMMARALNGLDIFPAAAHLTASMLSGAHPTVTYDRCSILAIQFGRHNGKLWLGSLDLIDEQHLISPIAVTATELSGKGGRVEKTWERFKFKSFDIVIMNPPFTRPTGQEAKKIGVPNPMFAAFNITERDQRAMSAQAQRLFKGSAAHGNAGEGSYFLSLADRMVKPGGMLGLVLPLSLMLGDAWEKSRQIITRRYSGPILISIAGSGDEDSSFSADTGSAECLVIAKNERPTEHRALFVVLRERPQSPMIGSQIAKQITEGIARGNLRRLEDGPAGGTPILFGESLIGHVIEGPLPSGSWNIARIADLSLAQSAHQIIANGLVWLPRMKQASAPHIPIVALNEIADSMGPYHADINWGGEKGKIRGPFDISDIQNNSAPTYVALWAHEATEQKSMEFAPDSEATPKVGRSAAEQREIAAKVETIWAYASHCHFNRDFRFNSQSTGMQFTPQVALGGRAWIGVKLPTIEQEKVMVLWANTSLGLLLHWWQANKQHAGRGMIGINPLETFAVLDVRELSQQQLSRAATIFDEFRGRDLLPLHEIDNDSVRAEMENKFYVEVLGWPSSIAAAGGPIELLRQKLAREPSVRGAKAIVD